MDHALVVPKSLAMMGRKFYQRITPCGLVGGRLLQAENTGEKGGPCACHKNRGRHNVTAKACERVGSEWQLKVDYRVEAVLLFMGYRLALLYPGTEYSRRLTHLAIFGSRSLGAPADFE